VVAIWADVGSGSPAFIANMTYRAGTMYHRLLAPMTSDVVQLIITDSNSEDVEIGELLHGGMVELPAMFRYGHQENIEEGKIEHQTERGVPKIYDLFNLRENKYEFEPLTEDERDEILALHNAVRGSGLPFLFVPILSTTYCIYGRKNKDWNANSIGPCRWSVGITIREESQGTRIEL
jgi:hypothetical protein